MSTARDVDAAVAAAAQAFPGWSETPPVIRARAMFAFKALLEPHFEELARHRHHRAWQDAGRIARQRAARRSNASKSRAARRRC